MNFIKNIFHLFHENMNILCYMFSKIHGGISKMHIKKKIYIYIYNIKNIYIL